jgi:hypothetical protein
MKKALFILILSGVFLLTSCKVCTTCQIKAGSVYESVPDEYCGTSSEVKKFEDDYQKKAADLGITGARAYCRRD